MSILADLKGVIGDALGDVFSGATLYQTAKGTSDGQGGFTAGRDDEIACKAMVETYSDARISAGIPVADRKIIVLAASLRTGITPKNGDRIRVAALGQKVVPSDRLWTVVNVDRDPAGATWELQAR